MMLRKRRVVDTPIYLGGLDQDIASETSNSRTEVGERTFGSMDAPSAVGNEGAFSRLILQCKNGSLTQCTTWHESTRTALLQYDICYHRLLC